MFITPPHREFTTKAYVDKQGEITTKEDILNRFSVEQLIDMIGIEKVQMTLRKMKLEKITKK